MVPPEEMPYDIWQMFYDDPIDRDKILSDFQSNIDKRIKKLSNEVGWAIEASKRTRWLYVRLDDILLEILAERKSRLTEDEIAEDALIKEIDDARLVATALAETALWHYHPD